MTLSIETVSSLVVAVAAVIGAISTIAIAYFVQRFSSQSARHQVVQTINGHFKAFSHSAFTDGDFAEFLQRKYLPDRSVDFVRDLYVVYYRLSLLDDIFSAKANGLLHDALERCEFDEWIQALAAQSPQALVCALSATPRGFAPGFVSHVKSRIRNLDALLVPDDRQ